MIRCSASANNAGPATTGLAGWASVQHDAELEEDGAFPGALPLPAAQLAPHGTRAPSTSTAHSHGRLSPLPRQVDVRVDAFGFRPVTLADIREHLRRRGRTRP